MSMLKSRLQRLALLTVMGGAGAYLVVWQSDKAEQQDKTKQAEEKLFSFSDEAKVHKIRLVTPKGEFVLERDSNASPAGGGWQLRSPFETPAEASTVNGMLTQFVQLRRTRLVGAGSAGGESGDDSPVTPPADLATFALAPPSYQVSLTARADDGTESTETVWVGKKNNFDGSVYAKRADQESVALVPGTVLYQVNKDLFSLRDKRVAMFDAADVSKLTVSLPLRQSGYAVERAGDGFMLVAPKHVTADRSQINGILSALSNLRAASFVAEAAASAEAAKAARANYGIDKPVARIELDLSGSGTLNQTQDPARQVLLFGQVGRAEAKKLYASLGSGGPIIELSTDLGLRKVDVTFDDLRDKHVLAFERDDVASIFIKDGKDGKDGERELAFEKQTSDADPTGQWHMTAPTSSKAQNAMLSGLLYKLWSLQAERVVNDAPSHKDLEDHGLAPGKLQITLVGKGGESLASVAFGEVEAGQRYATGSGGGRLDLVDNSRVEEISRDPDAYKEVEISENAP